MTPQIKEHIDFSEVINSNEGDERGESSDGYSSDDTNLQRKIKSHWDKDSKRGYILNIRSKLQQIHKLINTDRIDLDDEFDELLGFKKLHKRLG